eukprot:362839-Chlamydomonas_euryale.AAC.4
MLVLHACPGNILYQRHTKKAAASSSSRPAHLAHASAVVAFPVPHPLLIASSRKAAPIVCCVSTLNRNADTRPEASKPWKHF